MVSYDQNEQSTPGEESAYFRRNAGLQNLFDRIQLLNVKVVISDDSRKSKQRNGLAEISARFEAL